MGLPKSAEVHMNSVAVACKENEANAALARLEGQLIPIPADLLTDMQKSANLLEETSSVPSGMEPCMFER